MIEAERQEGEGEGAWTPDPAAYAYTTELSPFGWAWEFLRREPEFRHAAATARLRERATGVDAARSRRGADGVVRHVVRRPEPEAARWGLELFADPDANGLEASVFWTSDAVGGDLEAALDPGLDPGVDALHLADVPGCKAVLVLPGGRIRVLVEAPGYAETLSAPAPAELAFDRLAFVLGLGAWSELEVRMARLAAFAAFCRRPSGDEAVDAPWRRSARRLADALVALDGWRAGRSYREIAHAFHDPLEIEDDWRGPGAIKLRMRRRVAAGLALRQGGYRRLLTADRGRRWR